MTIEEPKPDRESARNEQDATVARIVHDLRQPLGVIIGYIDLLLDHPDEFNAGDRTAMLAEIRVAAARLDAMMHGMVASESEMP